MNKLGFPWRDTAAEAEKDAAELTEALRKHLGETPEVRAQHKRTWYFKVERRDTDPANWRNQEDKFAVVFYKRPYASPYRGGGKLGFDLDVCARQVRDLDEERAQSLRERLPRADGYAVKVTPSEGAGEEVYQVVITCLHLLTEEELFALVRALPPRKTPPPKG